MHSKVREILLAWKTHWESVLGPITTLHQWVFYHPLQPTKHVHGFRTAFETARKEAGLAKRTLKANGTQPIAEPVLSMAPFDFAVGI